MTFVTQTSYCKSMFKDPQILTVPNTYVNIEIYITNKIQDVKIFAIPLT